MSGKQPAKNITARWLSEWGIQIDGCPFVFSRSTLWAKTVSRTSRNRDARKPRLSWFGRRRSRLRSSRRSARPRIRFFRQAPGAFLASHGRTHRPIRWVLRTIESPGFHPKGKQKSVRSHTVSFRGGSSENQAWQRRPFPSTETAKSYNNRGGWAKSSTTIEVIEPENSPKMGSFSLRKPFHFLLTNTGGLFKVMTC